MYAIYFSKWGILKCFIHYQIYHEIKDTYTTSTKPPFKDDYICKEYVIYGANVRVFISMLISYSFLVSIRKLLACFLQLKGGFAKKNTSCLKLCMVFDNK